jgi:hypothetical protein
VKLFTVATKKTDEKYGELTTHWFVAAREPQRDCKPFMGGAARFYTQKFLEECLSQDEVDQLRAYLKPEHGHSFEAKEVELPILEDVMGFGAIGYGGGDRLIELWREEGYNLPFKVEGHYYLFENGDHQPDPDFDVVVDRGAVESAGGDPIGMAPEGEIPIDLIIKNLGRKNP